MHRRKLEDLVLIGPDLLQRRDLIHADERRIGEFLLERVAKGWIRAVVRNRRARKASLVALRTNPQIEKK